MKIFVALPLSMLLLSACSEMPLEEQGQEANGEMERQITTDAKTLEQAADEAVKILDEEIETGLRDEGVGIAEESDTAPD